MRSLKPLVKDLSLPTKCVATADNTQSAIVELLTITHTGSPPIRFGSVEKKLCKIATAKAEDQREAEGVTKRCRP